ncbi:MAG: hypothetical protein ACFFCW_45275 [Candidatus Hodarchaeota archaeon]
MSKRQSPISRTKPKLARAMFLFVAGFIVTSFIVVGISLMPLSSDRTFASKQGCCMARGCEDCAWYVIQKTYEECEELNQAREDDDVDSERGIIFWDSNC